MKLLPNFNLNPIRLFLIDSLGALLTAFFLFVILRTCNEYFGMPEPILVCLAAIAMVFCLYSLSCFLLLKSNWQVYLRIISIANLLYCCLTLTLVFYYLQELTFLGIAYFFIEILLVCVLVYVELRTISQHKNFLNA